MLTESRAEMANELSREDLLNLEEYALNRQKFREKVMAHKQHRRVAIGPNLTMYFESKLTIQYQVQEMLRIERIFERQAIKEELKSYNPLIPDRDNLKATMMLEYVDVDVRRRKLKELRGIERAIWLEVAGLARVFAVADEDLQREDREKTSAVHFLRFEINSALRAGLARKERLLFGVDHEAYKSEPTVITATTYDSLLEDLY